MLFQYLFIGEVVFKIYLKSQLKSAQKRQKTCNYPELDIKKGFNENAETLTRLVPRVGIEPARYLSITGF
jgi:hypothetical protein